MISRLVATSALLALVLSLAAPASAGSSAVKDKKGDTTSKGLNYGDFASLSVKVRKKKVVIKTGFHDEVANIVEWFVKVPGRKRPVFKLWYDNEEQTWNQSKTVYLSKKRPGYVSPRCVTENVRFGKNKGQRRSITMVFPKRCFRYQGKVAVRVKAISDYVHTAKSVPLDKTRYTRLTR